MIHLSQLTMKKIPCNNNCQQLFNCSTRHFWVQSLTLGHFTNERPGCQTFSMLDSWLSLGLLRVTNNWISWYLPSNSYSRWVPVNNEACESFPRRSIRVSSCQQEIPALQGHHWLKCLGAFTLGAWAPAQNSRKRCVDINAQWES